MSEKTVNTVKRRRWVRCVSFAVILSMLLALCSWILYPRDNTKQSGIAHPEAMGFTAIASDRIDVVAIGNSNIYSGFSPMELWGKYGYASYVSGEPRQQMASAVTLLQKYFETQDPKVVVLETDELYTGNNHLSSVALSKLEDSVPVIKYHNNWKTLRMSTLLRRPQHSYLSPMMGQSVSTAVRGYDGGNYMRPCGKTEAIPTAARIYLDKFRTLCAQHNVPLVLVSVPCAKSWSSARHNAVAQYAEQYGLPYLDLNTMGSAMNFDWKKDTGDGGTHLNASGARKVTLYLGAYLKEHYQLADRRGENDWSLWQENYLKYRRDYAAV